MIKRLEGFLFGKISGRIITRLVLSSITAVAAWLSVHGVQITPDQQTALVALAVSAINGLWTSISEWRAKRAV